MTSCIPRRVIREIELFYDMVNIFTVITHFVEHVFKMPQGFIRRQQLTLVVCPVISTPITAAQAVI